jgi:hypothetical protein
MKSRFVPINLIAIAILLVGSIAKAPAIMIRKLNGTTVEVGSLFGTVTHVDQNRRSFTIHWQLKGLLKMEHYYPSYEDTYRVTEGTVYKNGSWADMKTGIRVSITGHSDVADTVEIFAAPTGSDQNATAINQRGIAKQNKGDWDGAMADYNEAIKPIRSITPPTITGVTSSARKATLTELWLILTKPSGSIRKTHSPTITGEK